MRNDHFQGYVQAANQTLAYKTSKSNIQKVSHNNFSPNYLHLHDDRHLKRNRSASEAISGVELQCSNIYRVLIGKTPEPGTLKKSLPYTCRNLVSHILEGTNIQHLVMGSLILQDQLHQIYQGDSTITCIHNTMVTIEITCTPQQTGGIPYVSLAKW